jgi:hypothetical protein
MKYLLMTLAVVMMFAGPALAADHGNLSQSQLAKMGLSGMTAMTDTQGTAVRGMGFSLAFGASYAAIQKSDPASAGTVNGYLAVDSSKRGDTLAGGANLSVAGAASGTGNRTTWAVVGAAGGSIAFTGH